MDLIDHLAQSWHYFVAFFTVFISVISSGHAILTKRDTRAAVMWVSLIWLVPLVGAVLYLVMGVNRIRRRAILVRGGLRRYYAETAATPCSVEDLEAHLGDTKHLGDLARLIGGVTGRPLLSGNSIEILMNGDAAFPAMIQAINEARKSVTFCTYIFDNGKAGEQFAEALQRATKRGVQVRVLIDDSGARYSFPTIVPSLKKRGIRVARFMPSFAPFRLMSINLRNHRKVLVVDGEIGFTGGMNIRDGHLLQSKPERPVQDVHFCLRGPVVAQLQEVFADDWLFTTKEALRGEFWFPPLASHGDVKARAIVDGPDEDMDKLHYAILGALGAAKKSVRIVTPYFLPDRTLITALNVAALRGVLVDIIMPDVNNLPFVKWASMASLWQMLQSGCRMWFTPGPFDHSKLMVVDGVWCLIGSANWDTRSFRLNFELNLECYDHNFGKQLDELVCKKLVGARQITLKQVDARPLPIKLRDGVARLFNPYL